MGDDILTLAEAAALVPKPRADTGAAGRERIASDRHRAEAGPNGREAEANRTTRPDLTRIQTLALRLVTERTRAGLADRANAAASDAAARMARQAGASDADLAMARAQGCES